MTVQPLSWELQTPTHDRHGKAVTTLTMRAPTGRDVLECGYPYVQRRNPRNGETEEVPNTAASMAMIAACCDLPISAVEKLAAVDVFQAMEALRVFFHFKIPQKSSETSSAQDDGAETAPSSSA